MVSYPPHFYTIAYYTLYMCLLYPYSVLSCVYVYECNIYAYVCVIYLYYMSMYIGSELWLPYRCGVFKRLRIGTATAA